ncbi:hypothetical protein [Paraburkholderia terrae]
MSIFGNIMNTTFGRHGSGAATAQQTSPATSAPAGQQVPAATPSSTMSSGADVMTSTAASTPAQPAAARQDVVVDAVLPQMQANQNEQPSTNRLLR